jgi:tetratricopeptide (TPR) repeat protein
VRAPILVAVVIACALVLIQASGLPAADEQRLASHRNLGKAFYENPTTQKEAVEEFRKALLLASDSVPDKLNYGLALLRAGNTDEAVATLLAVQKSNPDLPHTWFNLGIVYKKQGENEKAIAQFSRMIELVPDDPISHYNLGALYKSIGRSDDALREFEAAARLDDTLAAARFQLYNAYRTQRRAEEAKAQLEVFQRLKKQQEGAAIPEDVEWNMFAEVYEVMESRSPASPPAKVSFAVRPRKPGVHGAEGDFDNDGLLDVCVLTPDGPQLLRRQGGKLVKHEAPLPKGEYAQAIWLDYDHDYDLDLILLGPKPVLLRNQGAAGFVDRTSDFPFVSGAPLSGAVLRVLADTKGFDLVVSYEDRPAVLYRDRLQGRYVSEDIAALATASRNLLPVDLNNDGYIDIAHSSGQHTKILWNRTGRLDEVETVSDSADTPAFIDLENRGWLDLVVGGAIHRNEGKGKLGEARPEPSLSTSCIAWDTGDFDRDGRLDLACGAQEFLNRTQTSNRWVGVSLTGVKNLKRSYGAEVEVKSGGSYQKLIYEGKPLLFGLGRGAVVDTVRITWANGLVQNEMKQVPGKVYMFQEAQRLSGSCPMIWSWNGSRFEYITDVLGVAPLGAASGGDDEYFPVDHDEFIQIPGKSLQPINGAYEIRITEELSEIAYLDEAKLIAVDHPVDESIFTNDKFKAPPFPEFRLFGVRSRNYPVKAFDHRGNDVRSKLLAKDATYPDSFKRDMSGVGEPHHLDFDFGRQAAPENRSVLVLSGWVDWADGSTFRNAAQQGKGGLLMPKLQVKNEAGEWQTVLEDLGIPAGKPKTIAVDLSGKFLSASREVRIVTNLCVYWDEIFLSPNVEAPQVTLQTIPMVSADLQFRGFSPVKIHPERLQPESFTYAGPKPVSLWNPTPGLYTRFGDVLPLLTEIDDHMVVIGSGDELRLRFSATALKPLPRGWTRDFLLKVDGWAKDRDANTAHSQDTEPMPFHGMTRYPYSAAERFPDTAAHRRYRSKYQTRPALRLMRSLAGKASQASVQGRACSACAGRSDE